MVLIPILFGVHHSSIATKEKDTKFNASQVIILTVKLYDVIKTMFAISNRIKYSKKIYFETNSYSWAQIAIDYVGLVLVLPA